MSMDINSSNMSERQLVTFHLGNDEKLIGYLDEGGVALAAIQGLNEKLTEAIATRDAKIQTLEQRLVALEKLFDGKTQNQNQ